MSRAILTGAAAVAAARPARLSIDHSSTAALAGYGAARFAALLAGLRPDVGFGTEAEMAMAMVGNLAGPELLVKLGARAARALAAMGGMP